MFDIGFTELLLIGVVALIVVGPKDLPGMFRTLGRFTARARQMGREFSQAMTDAADESGAKDIASTLKSATNPKSMGLDALNKAADGFEKWDPSKSLKEGKGGAKATPELEEKRAEAARKIHEATAKAEDSRRAAEAAAQEAAKAAPKAGTAKGTKAKAKAAKPAAKPAAKKPAAKKPATKTTKAAAKKPAAKSKSKPTDTSDA